MIAPRGGAPPIQEGWQTAVGIAAEVKERLSIVDVVGETVRLTRAGSTFKGLCPFHPERTPSFVVTPARGSWHCFGCGLGGDVFSFVMQRDGIPFPEALALLAARAGIRLDDRTRREDARRARLREALEAAIAFYHLLLTEHRVGQAALDYLRRRGFREETLARFQVGWAPVGRQTLVRHLAEKRGLGADVLVEAGLAARRADGTLVDRFRGRIIFPIRDSAGRAVGLGGRLLPPAETPQVETPEGRGDGSSLGPKYLNSPATPIFDKSRVLYPIDRAKGAIHRHDLAVIVEGYTDALMAHQAGFENVVASLGTALTPQQVALAARYTRRLALAYDVDPAGERAGTLSGAALSQLIAQLAHNDAGLRLDEVRVVRLPAGRDPDELIRDDPERWRAEVEGAQPIVEYLIAALARAHDLRTVGGQARFVDALVPLLRRLPPVLRDGYLLVAQRISGVDERTIREVLAAPGQEGQGRGGELVRGGRSPVRSRVPGRGDQGSSSGSVPDQSTMGARLSAEAVLSAPDALPVATLLRAVTPVEADLLRLLLLVPELQERVMDELPPERLPSTVARELYRAILGQRLRDGRGEGSFSLTALLDGLDPETSLFAQALLARPGPDPRELSPQRQRYAVAKCLLELEADEVEALVDHARSEIAEAERQGDRERLAELVELEREAIARRRALDRRREATRLLARAESQEVAP